MDSLYIESKTFELMKTYLIGYDLNKENGEKIDYTILKRSIIELAHEGLYWHCLDSTWLIKSNLDSLTILNQLKFKIDNNDRLLVVQIENNDASWIGLENDCSDWLKKYLPY
jgi:hypothetical protein